MIELSRLDNLSRFQATSTHPHALDDAVNERPYRLKIGLKPAFGSVVCVANSIAELRPFPAYITSLGHSERPPVNDLVMKANRESSTGGRRAVKPFRRSILVSSINRIFTAAVIAAALFTAVGCNKNKPEEPVATVGSHQITLKQVDSAIKQQIDASGSGTAAAMSPVELTAARLGVLDNLVQAEALFQRAQRDNLVPDDNKVTQEVQKRKQDAGVTEEQFQAQLKQAGLTDEDVKDKVRREMAINALKDREKARVTAPTEEETKKYYEDHKSEFVAERGADISVIAVSPNNNGGDTGAEQKIKAVYAQLRGQTDFATVATQKSEEPNSAIRGGRLGFASEDGLKQSFPALPGVATRLMAMKDGEYTEPLKDGTGNWYIFKLNLKREQAQNLTYDDPSVRKNIVDTVTQQRQQVLLNALMAVSIAETNIKNHLAERLIEHPESMVQMKPSALLQQPAQPQQALPRIVDENQVQNSNRPAANSNAAAANANRPVSNANKK